MTDDIHTRGPWVLTFTGEQFFPLDPRPEEVRIEDIAHQLANVCRFNGATAEFYSVAQHSIHVSEYVPGEQILPALLHDAAEAYIGDLVGPLVLHAYLGDAWRRVEALIQSVVLEALGVSTSNTPEIREADMMILSTEFRDLMPFTPVDVMLKADPHERLVIKPWPPEQAEAIFLERFHALVVASRVVNR